MEEIRKEIIDLLQLLSSKERQDEYQKNVPNVDIGNELICMWFDDLYIDGSQLESCFTEAELKKLKEFNNYFDEKVGQLPATYVKFWDSSSWRDIANKAKQILKELNWEPK